MVNKDYYYYIIKTLVVVDWIQVKLILKEQLDRETQVQHRMTLIAVDGGPQAKNDRPPLPVFQTTSNRSTYTENSRQSMADQGNDGKLTMGKTKSSG